MDFFFITSLHYNGTACTAAGRTGVRESLSLTQHAYSHHFYYFISRSQPARSRPLSWQGRPLRAAHSITHSTLLHLCHLITQHSAPSPSQVDPLSKGPRWAALSSYQELGVCPNIAPELLKLQANAEECERRVRHWGHPHSRVVVVHPSP